MLWSLSTLHEVPECVHLMGRGREHLKSSWQISQMRNDSSTKLHLASTIHKQRGLLLDREASTMTCSGASIKPVLLTQHKGLEQHPGGVILFLGHESFT